MLQLRAACCALGLLALAATSDASEYCFGSYEIRSGRKVAVLGETWTFDHGAPDSLEGWVGTKLWGPIDREVIGWAHLDDFADDGLPAGAPLINGVGMIWCGVHQATADSLCYECGLGYGPHWCQEMVSPAIAYLGGSVTLSFAYWAEAGGHWRVFTGGCSLASGTFGPDGSTWDAPSFVETTIPSSRFDACDADSFRVRIYTNNTDPGDSNCYRDTEFGAFGVDDVVVSGGAGVVFDFETGGEGWVNGISACLGPLGNHVGTRDLGAYEAGYDEWPDCTLEGRVLKYHDMEGGFSSRFLELAHSPVIDISALNLVSIDDLTVRFDQLQDYDLPHYWPGIWRRTRIRFYPDTCAVTGAERWSPWHLADLTELGGVAECQGSQEVGLLIDYSTGEPILNGVPDSVEVGFEIEVCRGCQGPDDDPSNVTPLFDNIQVCVLGSSLSDAPEQTDGDRHAESEQWLVGPGPNPLRTESELRLTLSGPTTVEVALFDMAGRRVARLGPLCQHP